MLFKNKRLDVSGGSLTGFRDGQVLAQAAQESGGVTAPEGITKI